MVKIKTSDKQKKYTRNTSKTKNKKKYHSKKLEKSKTPKLKLKKNAVVYECSPTKHLLDEEFIALGVWECLKNNDPEGVVEIIEAHLDAVNKSKATKEVNLSRSSLYNALKSKNPTVKTLAKLVNCCI